jgi:hypothetical protein
MEAIVDTSRPTIRFEHDGRAVEIVLFGDKVELYREYRDTPGLMQFCGYLNGEGAVRIRNEKARAAVDTAERALRAMIEQHRAELQAKVDAEVKIANAHLALGRAQDGCSCNVCDLFRRGGIRPEFCRS